MQWLKSYFDSHSNGQNLNYDAAARRAASKTGGVKGASGKARVPLSSATTTANVNGAAPVRSASISKKNPGTRQFGQAVAVPATAVGSGSQDTGMAAQVQEAAEQARLGCYCMHAVFHCCIASHCCVLASGKAVATQCNQGSVAAICTAAIVSDCWRHLV